MKIERVRTILGVWAPMAIGVFILATSINFYVTAQLPSNLESWRLVCSAGAFFVGGVLLLSTYGRYKKTKEARRETAASSVVSAATPAPHEDGHHEGNDHEEGD